MNWIFDGTFQYLENPQMWAANARDEADAWVFIKIKRFPFCQVEDVDPDDIVREMTLTGEYECFFFAEKKNKNRQTHIGWIKIDEELWPFVKKARILKMLFCRTKKSCLENSQELFPSAFV